MLCHISLRCFVQCFNLFLLLLLTLIVVSMVTLNVVKFKKISEFRHPKNIFLPNELETFPNDVILSNDVRHPNDDRGKGAIL